MVSLLHLAEITEEGVMFQSPTDGTRMLLTPEESISIQNRLGAAMRQSHLLLYMALYVMPQCSCQHCEDISSILITGPCMCFVCHYQLFRIRQHPVIFATPVRRG